jgi:alkanesulfonate monooxygenase SsuD/methylene tetrahydromethanopterin reductase-like flavin-dependent oxidoreductase (luciferase family)
MRGDLEPYDAVVQSLVNADRNGYDWVLCHDATDWPTPASVWNEQTSDLLAGAPDPNAVFAMDVAIASAGALTENVRFLWGPLDLVRRATVNIAQTVLTLDHATKARAAVILAQGQQNQLEPWLECGVTDAVTYNLAGMCSRAHRQSALAANAALLAEIKGRPVVTKLPKIPDP